LDFIQVLTTMDRREDADRLAAALVDRGLAGCVQVIGPIASTYRWKGKVETAAEWLCLIKTKRDVYSRIEQSIRELHPYEVPEIVAVPLTHGSRDYLDWLGDQIRS